MIALNIEICTPLGKHNVHVKQNIKVFKMLALLIEHLDADKNLN